jgi:hypothetical protein
MTMRHVLSVADGHGRGAGGHPSRAVRGTFGWASGPVVYLPKRRPVTGAWGSSTNWSALRPKATW